MSYSSCGCSGYSSGKGGYSRLESTVNSYNSRLSQPCYGADISAPAYSSSGSGSGYNKSFMVSDTANKEYSGASGVSEDKKQAATDYRSVPVTRTYLPAADSFLSSNRPSTTFVGDAADIKDFVEEAFNLVTGNRLPNNIVINVLSKEDFVRANSASGGNWNEGIQGFAINRRKIGLQSEIFVRKGELDRIMITLGHEIGHVVTDQLYDKRDEEAKAFAFSIAWMKKIKQFNVANLSTAIVLDRPAKNGLHDIALDFVAEKIKAGADAFELFENISCGEIKVSENV
jgi:hypothetical protein